MTNSHIPFPCSKNPSDHEGDDISSLLTKSTTGRIEAFLPIFEWSSEFLVLIDCK